MLVLLAAAALSYPWFGMPTTSVVKQSYPGLLVSNLTAPGIDWTTITVLERDVIKANITTKGAFWLNNNVACVQIANATDGFDVRIAWDSMMDNATAAGTLADILAAMEPWAADLRNISLTSNATFATYDIDCGTNCTEDGAEVNYDHGCCGSLVRCTERRIGATPTNCEGHACAALMEVCRPVCPTSGATHVGPWVATVSLSVIAQLI